MDFMHSMQPYSSISYFILFGVLVIPLVIAHLYGKKWMPYQVILTIYFLWLTFNGSVQIWAIIGFGIFQVILTKIYERHRKATNKTWFFYLAVILSILPLFFVKLHPLMVPQHPESILGFLGISYMTFKTVNVIIEIRDGLIKEVPITDYVYFLYFFPTISSGPIDRFRRFQKELKAPISKDYVATIDKAIFYVFQGFLYKFIIGHLIVSRVLHEAANAATLHPNVENVLISMYGYGLYLFFDFAGYSLFAIAFALLMGYDIPHNFNQPFKAKNIKDFWNRWHMSLSLWFRDFVAMRLAKFIMVKRWTKNMTLISNVGYLFSMGLMGFWHGFTWYYILYGFYHGFLLIAYDAWLRFKKKRKLKIPDNKITTGISIFITFNLVFIGFLIFSGIPDFMLQHWMNPAMHKLPNF